MSRVVESIQVGRLLCGPIRTGFEMIKFRFPDEFDYKETGGILTRTFLVSASERIWNQVVVPGITEVIERFKD
jgi:hypothetical protein